MKVNATFNLTDRHRIAVRYLLSGDAGKASREEVIRYIGRCLDAAVVKFDDDERTVEEDE